MYEELMEQVVKETNREAALKAVIRNKGAPGIDKMTTEQLLPHVRKHWESIKTKLLEGRYTPSPVRRVTIPKPGGGERKLGIPTVMDRFVQQMLLEVLQPIFEPQFSDKSYGFRPGRSAHMAVETARRYVTDEQATWVVDVDISAFFDRVHHDILMQRIATTIRDKRVLKLIGKYLRAGVMVDGVKEATTEGTPQGGPLSPLLANIYLDPLDKELEIRGLCFSRYADDCNIYVGSKRAAERVYENICVWIRHKLRLEVNESKSGVGRPWERKFLGFRIRESGEIEVAPTRIERIKAKVREHWRSCARQSGKEILASWRAIMRGWWNYFRLADYRRTLYSLDPWIRRHIRKFFWQRWHSPSGRRNALRKLGVSPKMLAAVGGHTSPWRVARGRAMQTALSNSWLSNHGFLTFQALAG